MLDDKRIKEAESNIRQYLQDYMLKKQTNKTAQEMYLENCDVSLQTAQTSLERAKEFVFEMKKLL